MDRVIFADSWKQTFAEHGLKSFRDFYNWPGKRKKRHYVDVMRLKIAGEEKVFYLKRFYHPYFKDVLFAMLNNKALCSQAAYEWGNMKLLRKNNIETSIPVCFGERIRFGIERKSFIVTEELGGQCMKDFIAQNWAKLSQQEKEKIIASMAKMIRRTHRARIGLTDLYVWHLFISEKKDADGNNEYDFAVLDLTRMKRRITGKSERIKNLGRLHYSMLDKYFNKPMRRLLVESYLGNKSKREIDKFARQVRKYAAQVSAKRRPMLY